jgi:glutathione S-transferase
MYRLYYSPGACSLAPHIALEEIGAPYALERISTAEKKTETPEWRAINPKGRVPALHPVPGAIGGGADILTEAPAILIYLARTHPEAGLLPNDPAGEARCLEWLNWLSGAVHAMSYGQIWRPARFAAGAEHQAAVTAKGHESVREQYSYVESLLGDGRDWAVPGGYSVADAFLLVFHHWGGRIGLDMAALYPAWRRLTYKVAARPAVARVLAAEEIVL